MSSLIYRAILISCSTGLSACATQTYPGPELSNDQIATVSLSSPSISWLPPFWIFPLNLATRLDEDWKHTVDYKIEVDRQELTRFNSISLLPGPHHASAQYTESNTALIGGKSCTSSDSRYIREDRNESCTRTTVCKGLFKFTEREHNCALDFSAAAGSAYQLLVTGSTANEIKLSLRDTDARQADRGNVCHWTPYHSHDEYITDTATSDCSTKARPPERPTPDIHVRHEDRHLGRDRPHPERIPDTIHGHPYQHVNRPHPGVGEEPGIPHKHDAGLYDEHHAATDHSDVGNALPRPTGKHKHPVEARLDNQEPASPSTFGADTQKEAITHTDTGHHPSGDHAKVRDINVHPPILNKETTAISDSDNSAGTGKIAAPTTPSASDSSSQTPIGTTTAKKPPIPDAAPNTRDPANAATLSTGSQAPALTDSLSVKDTALPATYHRDLNSADSHSPPLQTILESKDRLSPSSGTSPERDSTTPSSSPEPSPINPATTPGIGDAPIANSSSFTSSPSRSDTSADPIPASAPSSSSSTPTNTFSSSGSSTPASEPVPHSSYSSAPVPPSVPSDSPSSNTSAGPAPASTSSSSPNSPPAPDNSASLGSAPNPSPAPAALEAPTMPPSPKAAAPTSVPDSAP